MHPAPVAPTAQPDLGDPVLATLLARGTAIRRVRYRRNRSVLLSVSRDGRALNLHECFRAAPPAVIEAVVGFVSLPRRSARYDLALSTIRSWDGAIRALELTRRQRPRRRVRAGGGEELQRLRELFDRYNAERFGGGLPPIRLRVSRRMTRALGTIAYDTAGGRTGDGAGSDRAGVRSVQEIAISARLLSSPNESVLRDTLLHEMAHAEAWLRHGHRGHGRLWRVIARRVGCVPRAITHEWGAISGNRAARGP